MSSEWIFDTTASAPDSRIAYGDNPYQFAELRLPKHKSESGPIPLLIVIHGGYWLAEYGLDHITHLCKNLAENGIATWCIEYRRLGNEGGGWPGTFLDVAKSADHLQQIAEKYNLDMKRVSAIGHSAGGHLALWLASRHRINKNNILYQPNPLKINKAISLSGVNNLVECWEQKLFDNTNVVEHFMAGSPFSVSDRYQACCPTKLLPTGIKQILFHGDNDPFVPLSMSENYYHTAKKQGDNISFHVLQGAGHFEVVDPKSKEWQEILSVILNS